jgi:hypothetical protein
MKKWLLFLVLFLNFLSFGQKDNVQFLFPEVQTLFQGYANRLIVSFTNKKQKKFSVSCLECDSLFKLKDGSFILKVGMVDEITLVAVNRKNEIVNSKKFKVFEIPLPLLRLDKYEPFSKIDSVPSKINLKLSPEVPLNIGFFIQNWKITIDEKTISGRGSEITEEAKNFILENKTGMLIIDVEFSDPFRKRKITEAFFLDL